MPKKAHTEEQIVSVLRQVAAGARVLSDHFPAMMSDQCPLQESAITSVPVPAKVTVVAEAGTALHAAAAV
jgi:hypothetical protein